MLPGKAIRLPRPRILRSSEATKATPTPHQGPSSTAQSTLTMCCTGAHLLPNIGKLNTLPTTHRAQNIPARASFFTENFFIGNSSFSKSGRGLLASSHAGTRLPMTSYGGIIRIRSRVEVWLLPLSPPHELPCVLFFVGYCTPAGAKKQE